MAPVEIHPRTAGGFEKDLSLTEGSSLWDLMNPQEKEDLLARARESLAVEFEIRENNREAGHLAEMESVREEFADRFRAWTGAFSDALKREDQVVANDAAHLALAMAGKIIRDTVEVDRGFVVRTLETALYKVGDASSLTVSLHPDDVALLENDPDLKTRLRIENVVADRRVDRGGCRIRARLREWDATIASQLDALAAVVEETLGAGDRSQENLPGAADDSGLE